jgi:spore germination protein YaaH
MYIMQIFRSSKLSNENNGLHIIIYLEPQTNEFSLDFQEKIKEKAESLQELAKKYAKEKYPNLEAKSIKIMAGTLLVSTIILDRNEAEAATDFNMGYLYFGNTTEFIESVDRTQGVINTTSPSYFDLNTDGSLQLNAKLDQTFITEMHNRGKKVVPFLSNHWNRELGRAGLKNRELLSTQIAQAIEKYNLDGVNVDIENVTDIDRDNYTDLVRLLRSKIPAHKEVSVAVAANPNGWTKGWHGSYDYPKLAQYSDYLMIMAYDESYPGGLSGPVASISFVEKSIQYALNQGVPSHKVVLGLPHYGRYWKEGDAVGGFGISNLLIEEILKKYTHSITYDEIAQSPKVTFEIRSTDPTTVINGTTLSPGFYTLWYENNQSIKKKVELVDKYHIKGTGSWSIGQESFSLWTEFKEWLPKEMTMASPKYAASIVTSTSLRAEPSLSSSNIRTLDVASVISITGDLLVADSKSWYPVQTNSADQGYIEATSLKVAERVSGKERFEVSVNISKEGWLETSRTVILSNYNAFSDALTASPLAYKEDAPILLIHPDHITDVVKQEITRLKPEKVIIIDGEASISPNVIKNLQALGINNIERIGGKDRFEVSYNIAKRLGITDTAIITNGFNFPDALAISPYAARMDIQSS